ncbi:hypothetical protein J6590_053884 [Homalodisca vitripennis]|nr:hypothetical protein J6590_053884 [Homalodisca vitripennis]
MSQDCTPLTDNNFGTCQSPHLLFSRFTISGVVDTVDYNIATSQPVSLPAAEQHNLHSVDIASLSTLYSLLFISVNATIAMFQLLSLVATGNIISKRSILPLLALSILFSWYRYCIVSSYNLMQQVNATIAMFQLLSLVATGNIISKRSILPLLALSILFSWYRYCIVSSYNLMQQVNANIAMCQLLSLVATGNIVSKRSILPLLAPSILFSWYRYCIVSSYNLMQQVNANIAMCQLLSLVATGNIISKRPILPLLAPSILFSWYRYCIVSSYNLMQQVNANIAMCQQLSLVATGNIISKRSILPLLAPCILFFYYRYCIVSIYNLMQQVDDTIAMFQLLSLVATGNIISKRSILPLLALSILFSWYRYCIVSSYNLMQQVNANIAMCQQLSLVATGNIISKRSILPLLAPCILFFYYRYCIVSIYNLMQQVDDTIAMFQLLSLVATGNMISKRSILPLLAPSILFSWYRYCIVSSYNLMQQVNANIAMCQLLSLVATGNMISKSLILPLLAPSILFS